MAEHRKRYEEFAQELNKAGYIVYTNDHRGHGETAKDDYELGFIAEHNGWSTVISDVYRLTEIIKKENSQIPIFLFGHSMGSFIIRTFITKYGKEVDGAIICGTGQVNKTPLSLAMSIAKLEKVLLGSKKKSLFIERLLFAFNNKSIKPKRTKYDWLTRDTKFVDQYILDDYCGFRCTTSFYIDLLSGMKYLADIDNYRKIPSDLPMHFISGEKDPVGNKGLGIKKIVENYKSAGIKDIEYKIYPKARHEILNEVNKEVVYGDIIKWLNIKCGKTEYQNI